jgi:uncharacterized membrane-anchored protein
MGAADIILPTDDLGRATDIVCALQSAPAGSERPREDVVIRPLRQFELEPLAAKVPEITLLFWVIKLLTTAGGEATSDYLGAHNVVVGGAVELLLVGVALWGQFRVRRYIAPAYWFLALAIAVFGTGASDTLHIALGVPYAGTTIFWALVLAFIFRRWYRSEGTLSIHSITTHRREKYYWATVFVTFALGTALGDFTATVLDLGFLGSGILFFGLILLPLISWRFFRLNSVTAFWSAYVLTRPLGASFADYISKSHALSGVNFGDWQTSVVFIATILVLVTSTAIVHPDIQRPGVEE